jgi:NADH-quinone oxidoreductase subunit C
VTDHSPLIAALEATLGDALVRAEVVCDQLVAVVRPDRWREAALSLRDGPGLEFEQLIDLCGLDMQGYGDGRWNGPRFAVAVQLLSVRRNARLRIRIHADADDFPAVDSVVDVWAGANWFEREAFDMFGIVFPGHPDLRRLLTDYGFVGHPFRKDFPISGFVEMRYDPDQQRVVYQPVSIEPREIVPRVVREEHYGDSGR